LKDKIKTLKDFKVELILYN